MIDEKDIELRCGKKNPFTVPEGYFDSLTERVMANLPNNDKVIELKPKSHSYWKGISIAAAACVACAVVLIHNGKTNNETMANAEEVVYDEQYMQDMMEYAMVDANDVYACLSGDGFSESL